MFDFASLLRSMQIDLLWMECSAKQFITISNVHYRPFNTHQRNRNQIQNAKNGAASSFIFFGHWRLAGEISSEDAEIMRQAWIKTPFLSTEHHRSQMCVSWVFPILVLRRSFQSASFTVFNTKPLILFGVYCLAPIVYVSFWLPCCDFSLSATSWKKYSHILLAICNKWNPLTCTFRPLITRSLKYVEVDYGPPCTVQWIAPKVHGSYFDRHKCLKFTGYFWAGL